MSSVKETSLFYEEKKGRGSFRLSTPLPAPPVPSPARCLLSETAGAAGRRRPPVGYNKQPRPLCSAGGDGLLIVPGVQLLAGRPQTMLPKKNETAPGAPKAVGSFSPELRYGVRVCTAVMPQFWFYRFALRMSRPAALGWSSLWRKKGARGLPSPLFSF